MRVAFLLLPLLFLSGCGVVEMIAGGVADGTKFVVNKIENDPQVQETRRQQGYAPAQGQDLTATQAPPGAAAPSGQSYSGQTYSGQINPARPVEPYGGATGVPEPLNAPAPAPVAPVTRGEALN